MIDKVVKLRKTIAGQELYAKVAEYDSEGNKIAPNLMPDKDISTNGILIVKDGVASWDDGEFVYVNLPDPLNPLDLPEYTIRLKFTDGVTPTFDKGTAVQVSASPNIWDLTTDDGEWVQILYKQTALLEVLGANATGVTNMNGVFYKCTALTTVPIFDTASVTNMGGMFSNCSSLTAIPLFNTERVTEMSGMFYNCTNVESGALAFYQQVSSQSNPPSGHAVAFTNCGSNTVSGAAELAQIPTDWGGTAVG